MTGQTQDRDERTRGGSCVCRRTKGLRLIQRDRETLKRHSPNLSGLRHQLPAAEQTCLGCTFGGSTRWLPDCPERNAVIDHWTENA